MNENKTDGKAEEIKGRVKEATGDLSGNDEMKREGQKDQAKGNVRQAAGEVEETAKSAAGSLKSDTHGGSGDKPREDR
ncbi:CsbD family protein [Palleronia sp.]|uniref:CsbD family protein n=1 Tax=Palleronia sp. TaxID=1940284 RepID=UPI0035C80CB0